MTTGEKISKLRKENNMTQEQLAEVLGVSRQSVSKWESDLSYPETDKLIKLSRLFSCSVDSLLKADAQPEAPKAMPALPRFSGKRTSKRRLWGLPLWEIGPNAKGFFAVGLRATGVFSLGLWARGVVSVGLLSTGLLAFGMAAVGLAAFGLLSIGLAAFGCFAAGIFAAGAISLGVISLGAVAVGDFAVGAIARGNYFAMGDHASAMVALGQSQAEGSLYEELAALGCHDLESARKALDSAVPGALFWAKEWIKLLFL